MFLKGRKFKPAFEEFLLAKNINHDEQMMLFCHHSAQRLLLTYDDIFSYGYFSRSVIISGNFAIYSRNENCLQNGTFS